MSGATITDCLRSIDVPRTIDNLASIFHANPAQIEPGIGYDDWRYGGELIDPRAMDIASEFVGWDRKHCRTIQERP